MSPLLLSTRQPCLSCLRRSIVAGGASNGTAGINNNNPVSLAVTQVRGKKKGRPQSLGVVVRLLEDVPKFGPKHAIFRIPRGQMRNGLYPSKKAEYMTSARFSELGLSHKTSIGERDPFFGVDLDLRRADADADMTLEEAGKKVEDHGLSAVNILPPSPEKAAELLEHILPETLVFARRALPNEPKRGATAPHLKQKQQKEEKPAFRSPLLASNAAVSGESGAVANTNATTTPGTAPAETRHHQAIFGSVSAADVAARVRELLQSDPEASLIPLRENNVQILEALNGGGETAVALNKVRSLGTWRVAISVPGAGEGSGIETVWRNFEVVEEDA